MWRKTGERNRKCNFHSFFSPSPNKVYTYFPDNSLLCPATWAMNMMNFSTQRILTQLQWVNRKPQFNWCVCTWNKRENERTRIIKQGSIVSNVNKTPQSSMLGHDPLWQHRCTNPQRCYNFSLKIQMSILAGRGKKKRETLLRSCT